jgi:S-adenosylmethionine/arginine decarboxylase-like enzyme
VSDDVKNTIAALKEKPKPKAEGIKSLNTTESPYPAMTLSDKKHPPADDKSWGFHLLIDCSGLNEKMDSEDDIEEFFDKLIKALKMKKLTEFFCVSVDDTEDGRGISAFQMITTSHISMHFDDVKRCGYLDIFSCKKFDPDPAIKMIKDFFKPKAVASQLIYRDSGLEKDKK